MDDSDLFSKVDSNKLRFNVKNGMIVIVVAPPSPKVIGAHTPNFKPNLEFWLSPKDSLGAPQFLNLTYEVPPSSHRLAKFVGDRPRGLRDFAPKPFTPKKKFLGGPPNLRPPKSKCTHFQSCVKVSERSPQPSRRYSAAKCHKKTTAKHKPTWNYRSGWPNNQGDFFSETQCGLIFFCSTRIANDSSTA